MYLSVFSSVVPRSKLSTMPNIAIIGCGIVGLTTATVIQNELKSFAKITIFTEKLSPNTTSDIAAGLWGPYSVLNNKLEKMQKWGKITHDYFLHMWQQGLASQAGIILLPVISLQTYPSNGSSDRDQIVYGFQKIPEDALAQFRKQHNRNYKYGETYVTFACEPSIHMPYLQKKIQSNGGVIKIKKINNMAELSNYDVVINCSGLNARELCDDKEVVAIRGQIAKVTAPSQFVSVFSDSNYIIPNSKHVVVGGTLQLNDWETNVREQDTQNILNGADIIMPTLNHNSIQRHVVGLRPGRTQARLEMEIMEVGDKRLPVIHNYGHGGAGVTFSYGCAEETLELLKKILPTIVKSKL